MDRVTEEIAHFIGLFEINIEEARQREAYQEFSAEKGDAPLFPGLPLVTSPFSAPHKLTDFEPELSYQPPAPSWVLYGAWSFVHYDPPDVALGGPQKAPHHGYFPPAYLAATAGLTLPDFETIGSVATYIHQGIKLSDNDYFGVGGHGMMFSPAPADGAEILDLSDRAAALSPIDDLEMAGGSEELVTFTETVGQRLEDFAAEDGDGLELFVHKAGTIEGIFVNGQEVEEAPNLDDYYTFGDDEEEEDEAELPSEHGYTAESQSYHGVENGPVNASVEVEMGGNALINDAVLQSFWTAAPVTAVVGAYVEINTIIQINAWCDADMLSEAIAGWQHDGAPTQAFNIASFERFDTTEDDGEDAPTGGFPEHWVVNEIQGDLMIVNWLEQFTFMMDNDIGIVSSSGVTTRVSSGDNTAFNDVSLYEIGFGYDLIIIGGSVYDANIIHQLNILCDNDSIGAVAGFETSGAGSVSTSGNLLWNQASIYNVGGADRFEALPDEYKAAAENLAAGGDGNFSQFILNESAFAGDGVLSVLYISGDLINVQYAKQTNILGDSDQLALAMNEMVAYPGADWTVSTGSNALVNHAAIMDLDSTGKTYVGDGPYSQEVLVQADIISTDPELGGQNPDLLVNEAVAFLGDDMLGPDDDEHTAPYGPLENEAPQGDGLQTMLG